MLIQQLSAAEALAIHGAELDVLASASGSLFASTAWMDAWTTAFGPGSRYVLAVDDSNRLCAAASIVPLRPFGTASAANLESGDWTVTGLSDEARRLVWRHLADHGGGRVKLTAVPDTANDAGMARAALTQAGYLVATRPAVENPRLALPSSWNDLLASVSRNARSQYRRRLTALKSLGRVELRTAGPNSLEPDFERFLQLEGGGWKGEAKTSIKSNARMLGLYRHFVWEAAGRGSLRLQLLELDGTAVAADLSCTFAGGVFMLKTGYDERFSRLSPGFVLRGLALESAIAEHLDFWDFLGMADDYKLRWGSVVHPHLTISAFRGPAAQLAYRYHSDLRPRLKVARSSVRSLVAQVTSQKLVR